MRVKATREEWYAVSLVIVLALSTMFMISCMVRVAEQHLAPQYSVPQGCEQSRYYSQEFQGQFWTAFSAVKAGVFYEAATDPELYQQEHSAAQSVADRLERGDQLTPSEVAKYGRAGVAIGAALNFFQSMVILDPCAAKLIVSALRQI